jgi:glycosyltransferase involved in cell wall biosynthesis
MMWSSSCSSLTPGSMRPTKVVHMTSVHTPFDPRIFHKECRSLARAGFDVTVVGTNWKQGEKDHIQVKSVSGHSSRVGRMTRTVWSVYREAAKQNADVYHFHDPELIPIGLLLRACGKHVIYDIHEDMPKEILSKQYLPNWTRSLVSWVVSRMEATVSGQFSALVVVTPSIAKRFQPLNQKTVIVHNYPYVRELIRDGHAISWDLRRQSVAYVGGLTWHRAIREMVQAMALLPDTLPATLELAGPEAKEDTSIMELTKHPGWSRVKHHGFIDQRSTFHILQNVRAGLVLYHPEPNQVESMPQKIFEYMGAGLPIIASDFPLWKQLIGGAGCGIFVDPLKPSEIAKAIEYIFTHPREAEEMGRRGQAAVLERFNWDTEAEKLIQLYQSLQLGPEKRRQKLLRPSTN